jgi:uncharacterized lipoprotein YajG
VKALVAVALVMLSGCALSWESEMTTEPSADLYAQACVLEHCVSVGGDANTAE